MAMVADALGQVVRGSERDAKVVHHAVKAGFVHTVIGFVQVQGKDVEWEVLGDCMVGTW